MRIRKEQYVIITHVQEVLSQENQDSRSPYLRPRNSTPGVQLGETFGS